jgi:hypothetical protein
MVLCLSRERRTGVSSLMPDRQSVGDARAVAAALVSAIIKEAHLDVSDRVREIVELALTQDLILAAIAQRSATLP